MGRLSAQQRHRDVHRGRTLFQLIVALITLALWSSVSLAQSPALRGPTASSAPETQFGSTPRGVWDQGALGEQAALLEREYKKLGHTQRLKPRLLDQSAPLPLVLHEELVDPRNEDCVTITALGMPNLSFIFLFASRPETPPQHAWPVPSAAGVAEVTRCGNRKGLLSELQIRLRSRRGIVEFLVLRSPQPPPPVSEILLQRNPGTSLPSPQVGRRPWLAPMKERLALRTQESLREGARTAHPSALVADTSGRGGSVVHLTPGCHRLELLAEADRESPADLDAGLYTLARGEELVSDEEHSGEVTLEYCVGGQERVRLEFSGVRPHAEITFLHSLWDLPDAFPPEWGPIARGRLARAVWQDGLKALGDGPVYSALGVRGTTQLAVQTDPDACYLVALAPIRGEIQALALAAEIGNEIREGRADRPIDGTSLNFCANGSSLVSLETQALGSGLAWILGVWRIAAPSEDLP